MEAKLRDTEAERGALREALAGAVEALKDFRAYYISDHRLGGTEQASPEIRRADAALAKAHAALKGGDRG
jgi:hypothetical protein